PSPPPGRPRSQPAPLRPATPEGNAALRLRLEELLGTYADVRKNLGALQQRVREAQGEARSKDGSVRVRVGPQGNLLELVLEPRAYRRLSPSELAAEILELARQATREVQGQMEQVMAPFLPKDVAYADVLTGQADPASWAPKEPLTSETFDTWWAGIGQAAGPQEEEEE
ncbi:MAG: YbaB/EbfC family nucleoid-associated protein, partial [Actinomycetota bacterium]|nr:YbaB/EbfC family nucleoid-associated protein [Actinomycetota bacterium]